MPDLLVRGLPGLKSDATFYSGQFSPALGIQVTYEICQVNMSLRVQQDVIWLDVAMNDALGVDISERAAQLCNPEPNGIFRETFSRDMEP